MRNFFLFLFVAQLFVSCTEKKTIKDTRKPIARVYDKYLYKEDLEGIVPIGVSSADSSVKIDNYIDVWISKQLFVNSAKKELSVKEKDFKRLIDDYRNSLLIYQYKKKFFEKRMNREISEEDIIKYYLECKKEFVLSYNIVKVLYIKIPLDAPKVTEIKYLYKLKGENNYKQIEEYCYKYADKFHNYDEKWVPFSKILKEVPVEVKSQRKFLRKNKFIEKKDSIYHYFVKIQDYKVVGDISPMNLVTENIKSILLNKRKSNLISELEKELYRKAVSDRNLDVYRNSDKEKN